jgi:hypothetical protein
MFPVFLERIPKFQMISGKMRKGTKANPTLFDGVKHWPVTGA